MPSGAWLSTALSVCTEALLSDRARRALIESQDTDTVTTRVFDIALGGYPWPVTIPERLLRNAFTYEWDGREDTLSTDHAARGTLEAAIATDGHRLVPINAGQGVAPAAGRKSGGRSHRAAVRRSVPTT